MDPLYGRHEENWRTSDNAIVRWDGSMGRDGGGVSACPVLYRGEHRSLILWNGERKEKRQERKRNESCGSKLTICFTDRSTAALPWGVLNNIKYIYIYIY